MSDTNDEKRRDEVLKRMLSTPPKKHETSRVKPPAKKPEAAKPKGRG